ncbi:MAG: LTA synthase family protein [Muribaculaceae bacterium]|nr:LTA synthase family protein [Muribaculaceae bacterium]
MAPSTKYLNNVLTSHHRHTGRGRAFSPRNGEGGGLSRGWICLIGMFVTLITGVVIWCASTTFRAMSDWMLYADNLLAALILSLPAILCRRVWVQLVMMVLVDIVWIANIMYCRTYFTGIPWESYFMVTNLLDFTASVRDAMRWEDIALPLVTMITGAWAYLTPASRKWPGRWLVVALTAAMAVVVWIGLLCRGGFYASYDKFAQSCYYSTCGLPTYTVVGHLAYNNMTTSKTDINLCKKKVLEWELQKEYSRPFVALSDTVARRKNLVILLLESFESWPLGATLPTGDGEVEITPYINSLLARPSTLYAPRMLTQVGAGRSIDAQLLLGCGMLPMLNSVYSMKAPDYDYPSLMKAMKQLKGGRSVLFTCDKPITWNQSVIGHAMGYDSLLFRDSWKMDELIGNPAKLSDGSFLRQCVEKLKAGSVLHGDEPFIMTFVTYSGHNPFRLPENFKDPRLKDAVKEMPEVLSDYIQMAHYTDSQLHTLIDYIQSRPDAAETVVLITGDHEGLASYRDDVRKDKKGAQLVDAGQHTPFILLNSPVGGRIDEVMGQIDVYPTLLSILGLEEYSWKGMGQNILAQPRAAVAISSMTGTVEGDTARISPDAMKNIRQARRVSDMKISNGL